MAMKHDQLCPNCDGTGKVRAYDPETDRWETYQCGKALIILA